MKLLHCLARIPADARVALFGAGLAGSGFLSLVRTFRPDVEVVAFIDSFKRSPTDDLPTLPPDELNGALSDALIIITSMKWREIASIVKAAGIDEFLVVPQHILHPSVLGRLSASPHPAADNTFFRPPISPAGHARYANRLERVAGLLQEPEQRELFHTLTRPSADENDQLQAIGEFYLCNRQRGQYLDFIRYDAVNTIIEGGVYDGRDSLNFLDGADQRARIFGFEPGRENFSEGAHNHRLSSDPRFELLPYALWSESTQLALTDNGAMSRLVPTDHPLAGSQRVETRSIDDFVAERAIPRVDLIKLDIEGAEMATLRGALSTLVRDRPQLAICIYHQESDYVDIPLFINEHLPNYRHHIGHYTATWTETVWYASPNEIFDAASYQ